MNLEIQRRAGQLVSAAGAAGLVVGLREAVAALRRYNGAYNQAYQFIERNARRNYRGDIQSRFEQRLGNNMMEASMSRGKFVAGPSGPAKRPRYGAGNPAPAGVQQLTYHKRVYGKKKKVNVIARMKKQLKELEVDMITRWQSIFSPQPTAQALLTLPLSNDKSAEGLISTSLYCFNLSSLGRNPNQGWKGIPMYRLAKDTTVDKAVQAWDWQTIIGSNNQADGTSAAYDWQLEHYEGGFDTDSYEYRHDWSDIKLMLQGTVKYPIRFHVYRVKFLMDGLGPRRRYFNAANAAITYDDALSSTQDISECDYFWERFMEPKIVHPFASTKKTGLNSRRHLQVISHEVMSLGSEVTIASDVQPLQHIHSMFVKSGKYYKNVAATNVEADLMPIGAAPTTLVGIKGDGAVGYSNTNDVTATAAYGSDRSKDEWLIVCAENYQQVGAGYDPDRTADANNTPSFDIRVRSKFTCFQK